MAKAKKSGRKGDRLQKIMSRHGVASRRASEELIRQGRVSLNGEVVTELGTRATDSDEIRVDGERIGSPPPRTVILLNKPTGALCSEDDPEGRPLVHDLIPDDLALHAIGRLDFNTEGVLLLTNDGDLALRLSHPRYGVQRVYEARVRGIPDSETLNRLIRGVQLDDGPARVESCEVFRRTDRNSWVRLTLTEGRNREVRRLMERVGHPVMRLRRVRFAGLETGDLKPGRWRPLHEDEIAELEERGQVGGFQLPPDPRREGARVGGVLKPGTEAPRAALRSEGRRRRRRGKGKGKGRQRRKNDRRN